jgi:hypothetical protein
MLQVTSFLYRARSSELSHVTNTTTADSCKGLPHNTSCYDDVKIA